MTRRRVGQTCSKHRKQQPAHASAGFVTTSREKLPALLPESALRLMLFSLVHRSRAIPCPSCKSDFIAISSPDTPNILLRATLK